MTSRRISIPPPYTGQGERRGERRHVLGVDERGDGNASGRERPLDHEVALGEEQPGAGVVALLGAAGQPALVQPELPEQRIVRILDRNDLDSRHDLRDAPLATTLTQTWIVGIRRWAANVD